jgi:hypothetical protein
VAVPPGARARSTLPRIDYADSFLVETGLGQERTAEQWARAILEDAPILMQQVLRWGWATLGLKLRTTPSRHSVLGWEVRHAVPNFVLLGAHSRTGMPAELLFERQRSALTVTTFCQLTNPAARAVWVPVERIHRRVVPYVLGQRVETIRAEQKAR